MYRFVLSPRWLVAHVVVAAVALTFARLGVWQLDRLDQHRSFEALVEARASAPPVPLERAIPPGTDVDSAAYRRVDVTGTYDPAHEIVLFGRSLAGAPGNHVLTPLRTAGGAAIIVDRGWVPIQMETPPVAPAAPPGGTVRLTGTLLPPESASAADGDPARLTQVARIDLARIGRHLPYRIDPVFLWLRSQSPPPADLPRIAPLPDLTEAPPHLSYALQWFSFAAIGLIGYAVLIRKESHHRCVHEVSGGREEPATSVPIAEGRRT